MQRPKRHYLSQLPGKIALWTTTCETSAAKRWMSAKSLKSP